MAEPTRSRRLVDSYRFVDFASRQLVKNWIRREPKRPPVWTPMRRPLSESRVALVSTAGLALADDLPFDQEGERRNPWWGDPTFRVLPRDAAPEEIRVYHLHVDPEPVETDPECAFPLGRLTELEAAGAIGRSARCHYSFMGYQLCPDVLLAESVPAMVEMMAGEEVDVVLLVPY